MSPLKKSQKRLLAPRQTSLFLQDREIWVQPRKQDAVATALSLSVEWDWQGRIVRLYWLFRDLRDRKRLETSLRISEERYRLLSEISPVGIFRNDITGACTYVNEKTIQLVGGTLEDSLGLNWVDTLHPDDRQWVYEGFQAFVALSAVDPNATNRFECRHLHRDGAIVWVLVQIVPERDSEGNITGYIGTLTDISDRKQAEEALRRSEERYRHLVEITPQLVWNADAGGRNTYVSQQMCDYIGLPSEQLLNLDWQTVIHPDDVERIHRRWMESVQTGIPYEVEYRLRRADGVYCWQLVRAIPWHDEQGIQWFGASTDITDRKQAEAALCESEEKYRSLFESIDEGYLLCEVIFNENEEPIDIFYLEANPAAIRLAGRDFIGRWMREIDPNYEDYWYETLGRVALTGESVRAEYYAEPHGRWFDFYVSRVGGAQSRRVASIFQDTTDRKNAEKRQAFLLKLSDLLRSLSDPVQIQAEACRLLGEQLGADRAYYVEIHEPEGYARVNQHYSRGDSPSIVGNYRLSEYGWSLPIMRRGETIVIADTQSTDIIPDFERAAMARIAMIGFVAIPLIKGEILVGSLAVNEPTPREWTEAEVDLVRETAERIWADIQRAHAEADLRESEEKYRSLFEVMEEGFCSAEVVYDEAGQPIDHRFLEANPAFERQTNLPHPKGQLASELMPGLEQFWNDFYARIIVTGKSERIERYSPAFDRWFDVEASRLGDASLRRVAVVFRDITDRKQAEAALREADQRFRTMADTTPVLLWETDETGVIFLNSHYLDFFGVDFESVRTLGWERFMHPEDAQGYETAYRQAFTQQQPYEYDCRFRRADGEYRWLRNTGQPMGDRRFVGCSVDITDRKLAEEQLRHTAELGAFRVQLTDALRSLADPMEVQATATRILGEYLGANRALYFEVRGSNYVIERDYINGADTLAGIYSIDAFGQSLVAALRYGRTVVQPDVSADSSFSPDEQAAYIAIGIAAHIGIPLIKGGELVAGLAVHTNQPRVWTQGEVTLAEEVAERTWAAVERTRAEASLRESERKLSLFVKDAPVSVAMFDRNMNYIAVSQRWVDAYQLGTIDAVLGHSQYEVMPDILDRWRQVHQRCLAGAVERCDEDQFTLPDGSQQWLRWEVQPWETATGEVGGILIFVEDITEKKQLEAQFYHAQRLESLGTLAGGIAHDLNNVLTPIVSISQLLRLHQPTLDGKSREMLKILEESAKRGATIIKQILTFTRGTGGERRPVQIAPILQEVIDVARQTFPKSIAIHEAALDAELQLISVDPTYLHQVLMNLCVNARDAMPDGGAIALSAENFYVDELFIQMHLDARVGNYLLITVADTGSGIPPEVRDRIFEPFFTTKAIGRGTGLGLASVLGIVKAYGGFIELQSQSGSGSQFKIYLPAIAETEAISNDTQTELPQGQGELILIVDDEIAILQSAQVILEAYNYRVITASRGADAIEIYRDRQDEIHVVLMDMMMPEMDGITAIQALQAINPQVKAIASSGLAGNYRPTLQTLGIATLLTKPFNTVELLRSLHGLKVKGG